MKTAPEANKVGLALFKQGKYIEAAKTFQTGMNLENAVKPVQARLCYNEACCFSMAHKFPEAMKALEQSFTLGYDNFEGVRTDPNLKNLREDGEPGLFAELLASQEEAAPMKDVVVQAAQLNKATVWHNLTFADQMIARRCTTGGPNPVPYMAGAALAYYKLYPDATPATLERDFRKRGFETGLIAAAWRDDPHLRPLVEGGEVVVRPYSKMKSQQQAAGASSSSDYYVMYSCRPRKYAEDERSQHNSSVEENLTRLETAGDLGANVELPTEEEEKAEEKFDDSESLEFDRGFLLSLSEKELLKKVMNGVVKLCYRARSLESVWLEARESHPQAKQVVLQMSGEGPLTALAEGNKIICPVGQRILFASSPQECEYLLLKFH